MQLARGTAAEIQAQEEEDEAAERKAALAALAARMGWRLKPQSLRGITLVQVRVERRCTTRSRSRFEPDTVGTHGGDMTRS